MGCTIDPGVVMSLPHASLRRLILALACTVMIATVDAKDDKPSISLKASPAVGFAPVRIVLTADLRGGADDYEEFYCATIEWDMGDGNKSEQRADCDPYEPGKSQIKRHFVKDQTFNIPGNFRIQFILKQKDKIVGVGRTTIRVQPGLRDGGGEIVR
jgi:hypothetical protein